MPRAARKLSLNGYMHIIIRGIGRQIIFEDRQDHSAFLSRLKRFSNETGICILAYCLMSNHVHLLIHDPNRNTPEMMRKMGTSYAAYFNKKYERTGHLFQNRYKNENIETDAQLLNVFRYILNNPAKAGICPAAFYEWSSYSQYDPGVGFVDTSYIRELLGNHSRFDAFLAEETFDQSPQREIEAVKHLTDEQAADLIRENLHIDSLLAVKSMDWKIWDHVLHQLKQEGLSVRQIERMTGISKSVVQRA